MRYAVQPLSKRILNTNTSLSLKFFLLMTALTLSPMTHAQTQESINLAQQMFVAYYGRPGDPDGLNYWADRFDESNNLDAVLFAFGNSQEYNDSFGALTSEQLVDGLFFQMFNRGSDSLGLAFYLGRLESGEATLASIAKQIADGTQGSDRFSLDNKIAVANAFTDRVDSEDISYVSGDISSARGLLTTVTSLASSVNAGLLAVSSWVPQSHTTNDITELPSNRISHAFFRDQDGTAEVLAGTVLVEAAEIDGRDSAREESVWVYWADDQGNTLGEVWLKTDTNAVYTIVIPNGTPIPENTRSLLIYPANEKGQASDGTLVRFHDFIGNAALSGPGGNEQDNWYYGIDRAKISVQRSNIQDGLCVFDNGLVSVIDMNNVKDESWEANSGNGLPNNASDSAFPPYEFLCDSDPVNIFREISDEVGIWTYSTLNDSMFYGTIVYDTFVKYLGEPPLEEKLRLRVHYGNQTDTRVYWDGAYANFSDGYLFQYSMAPLDAIAHEVGHGVLNRISDLDLFNHEISTDARTLHEAFGDLAGVMAKYEFSGQTNNWIHGEEAGGFVRRLDQILTESGAIPSFLDYDDAGDNFYLRIGMITYPFYLLSNQWGIEPIYKVYLDSAKTCWSAMTSLTEAAECIKQQAGIAGLPEADVVNAFKTVKIKLFSEGVLSHFNAVTFKLRTAFTDDSRSTSDVTQWFWDFGDGQTSTETNPEHTFSEAGDYQVSLMVTESSNDQDTFTRLISVTDQYCEIREDFGIGNHITNVKIDGTDMNYDQTLWDYTQTPIEFLNPDNTLLEIQGESTATERSTTWRAWIDLNDDGVFGDTDEELVADVFVAEGQPYGLNAVLDLSNLPNDGETKFMRIIGDYTVITPCSAGVGEALDVRVFW
ncbi:MAG: vibriolysin [Porticoccaceae bacterium]|jgi:vibriolysin